ncbi:Asp-tRNA(Asn)/Glu-tRNA(Gln) amidotransferase subunit GatC [Spirosoma sordidisoli]|uniref:Aspartyl/glutamyl-tRNA(Asn/Gln) amidotransferase subunit C n=1 Tax=Spirosoma sordidisoli TaxID=2502893 RepID=A0A4Q2UF18_9BACT|nr:Asp-tRNA(Asn)/Glu-tRNA(Gln) amidotransferase subunit GatC [Spirosoma sordidisoli]RYC67614.1 Asp-tRNA(Asn)/Glu-tRNA(Gln) amidotransferase subunit GatC [Spirosoma sordidisoli]
MKVDSETLQKIAHLARLEVKPDEEEALLSSMNGVLTWMEQLNEVDTTGVEPLTHISPEVNVLRDDVVGQHLSRDQALANSPQHNGQFFEVPKVME